MGNKEYNYENKKNKKISRNIIFDGIKILNY
jgi:hypothetical protein